jgi:O-antigen/teichoic acid export membrane protein
LLAGRAIVTRFINGESRPHPDSRPRVADVSKPRRAPSWVAGSGVIAVAMGVMNLGTYGFTVAAARILGPREYGAIAAVMGLMLVLSVVSLGFQATAARQVSMTREDPGRSQHRVVSAAGLAAGALTALLVLATPLVSHVLRLDSWWAGVLLALGVLPLTLMGAYAGVFQGEQRWLPLAAVYVGAGVGRLVLGGLGMVLWGNALGALLGVAVGNALPAVLGWWFLHHPSRTANREHLPGPSPEKRRALLTEVAHDCHALLAFFALANVDVIIARWALPAHDAGLYAAGLIMTKAVLFLPQFVVVIAFPSMVREQRRRMQNQALLLVLGIGLAATLLAWLLAPLAVVFVGGRAYADLEPSLWAFAALGALLAMIQLLVYGSMAHGQRTAVALVWGGLAVLLGVAFLVGSVTGLLATVAAVHTTVLLALVALSRRHSPVAAATTPS